MGMCERDSRPCTAEHLQGLFCTIFHDDCCRSAADLDSTHRIGLDERREPAGGSRADHHGASPALEPKLDAQLAAANCSRRTSGFRQRI